MAGETFVKWIVTKDRFPEIARSLEAMGRRVETETAEVWRDAAQEVLYPGHGYVSGALHDGIKAEGNQVWSEEEYSGPVNDGHGSFAGYGFWDQGQMTAEQYFEDTIWRETRKAVQ